MLNPSEPRSILVINDSGVLLSILHVVLEEEGFRVDSALSPPADLAGIRERLPLVILVDYPARRDDAVIGFLFALALDPETVAIPLVMTCAYPPSDILADDGVQLLSMQLVQTPFSIDSLLVAIDASLAA